MSAFAEMSPAAEFLRSCQGAPVRVSLFSDAWAAPFSRLLGRIQDVTEGGVTIELLDPLPAFSGRLLAAVQVLKSGQFYLFHAYTLPGCAEEADLLPLEPPVEIRTIQQREHPRVDTHLAIRLLVEGEETAREALMINLSAGGAAVEGPNSIALGARISLVFDLGSGFYFRDVQATVLRSSPRPSGTSVYGLRFEGLGNEERLALERWAKERIRRHE